MGTVVDGGGTDRGVHFSVLLFAEKKKTKKVAARFFAKGRLAARGFPFFLPLAG